MRTTLPAAIVIPLALLLGVPASAWHGEHPDERECAVCHFAHQTADSAPPAEFASSQAPVPTEQAHEVCRGEFPRYLRQPARAPPA